MNDSQVILNVILVIIGAFAGAFISLVWLVFGSDEFIERFNDKKVIELEESLETEIELRKNSDKISFDTIAENVKLQKYNLALNQKIMEVCEHNDACRNEARETFEDLERMTVERNELQRKYGKEV